MKTEITNMVRLALAEDIGSGDITAELIDKDLTSKANIITREDAVLCGVEWANEVFHQVDSTVKIKWHVHDGAHVAPNQELCEISGRARSLLSAERCALNFLQLLSGIATVTREYANCLLETDAHLLDTRKTLPGLRFAEKYAVRCGGGQNHRMGLYDAFLIKENHIQAYGSIDGVIVAARKSHPDKKIEIEVEDILQLREALDAKADIIMLDNFNLDDMREAVIINDGQAKLEASGGVTLRTIRAIAETGVDYISVGTLTKDIQSVDLSMRFV